MATKKQIAKQQREERKLLNRGEVIELINKHAQHEASEVESIFSVLREVLQGQIIINTALMNVLKKHDLLTDEELNKEVEKVTKDMNEMLQKNIERGED